MIDTLGHPITAGCTVLTAPHRAQRMSEVIKVERTTKTRVVLKMLCTTCHYDRPSRKWSYKKEVRELHRYPYQVLVIDKQLKYNRKMHPEHML